MSYVKRLSDAQEQANAVTTSSTTPTLFIYFCIRTYLEYALYEWVGSVFRLEGLTRSTIFITE